MSDLTMMKRELFIIKKSFEDGSFDLRTVSNLLQVIKDNCNKLTEEQASFLLDIPLSVLENDVELRDISNWQDSNKGYFLGNMQDESEFIDQLKSKISSREIELEDMHSLLKYVQTNFKDLSVNADYLLRNPLVTIRDDVTLLSYSNFNSSGKAFAANIDKALA